MDAKLWSMNDISGPLDLPRLVCERHLIRLEPNVIRRSNVLMHNLPRPLSRLPIGAHCLLSVIVH